MKKQLLETAVGVVLNHVDEALNPTGWEGNYNAMADDIFETVKNYVRPGLEEGIKTAIRKYGDDRDKEIRDLKKENKELKEKLAVYDAIADAASNKVI